MRKGTTGANVDALEEPVAIEVDVACDAQADLMVTEVSDTQLKGGPVKSLIATPFSGLLVLKTNKTP